MKLNSITLKVLILPIVLIIGSNLFLIIQNNKQKNILDKFNNEIITTNIIIEKYQNHINKNLSLFRIPVDSIQLGFPDLSSKIWQTPNYIILLPSDACSACVSTFYSEIKSSEIKFENAYLYSEIYDERYRRLWVSNGFDLENFVTDSYDIFRKYGIRKDIVVIKFSRNSKYYDLFQYDISLGGLLQSFINEK